MCCGSSSASSDREGERIEDFSATLLEPDGDAMTCECAWTRRYLADGVTKPTCCDNGNFKGYQCQVGRLTRSPSMSHGEGNHYKREKMR